MITYDDVELPANRLADRLRAEQYRHFRGETWLEDVLKARLEPTNGTTPSFRHEQHLFENVGLT